MNCPFSWKIKRPEEVLRCFVESGNAVFFGAGYYIEAPGTARLASTVSTHLILRLIHD
jgi:hypothetical protein